MPDWSAYVRQNLNLPNVLPADEASVVEEIARQLDDAYQEGLNSGLLPEEAAAEAKLHITDWKDISTALAHKHVAREEVGRRMDMGDRLESFIRDIRYAMRRLRKSPVFTVIAVLTLGLGIGANTAIFSAINALLLNPVGLPDPDRILSFGVNYEKLGVKSITVSIAEFLDVRDSKDLFSATAIAAFANYNYSTGDFPERLSAERVTWQWFDVFDVKPMLGRLFTPEEDQPNMNQVVILDHTTWRRLFGGDPSIIAKTIELNQQPYRVIGVMPPEFHFRQTAVWVPLGLPPAAYTPRSRFNESYELVARMKPGVSFEQAMAHVRLLTDRVHQQTDRAGELARNNRWSISAKPYVESVTGDLKSPMFVLMGAVGFVLLIACANVAGLVVARAPRQSRGLAPPSALGSGRWGVLRQTRPAKLFVVGGRPGGRVVDRVERYTNASRNASSRPRRPGDAAGRDGPRLHCADRNVGRNFLRSHSRIADRPQPEHGVPKRRWTVCNARAAPIALTLRHGHDAGRSRADSVGGGGSFSSKPDFTTAGGYRPFNSQRFDRHWFCSVCLIY